MDETLDEIEVEVEVLLDEDEVLDFYKKGYGDLFFEIGILYSLNSLNNKDNPRAILGIGAESKIKKFYIIYQNCIDLVYNENIVDFIWIPTFFLGNSIVKIGGGTPLEIGGYTYGDNLPLFISMGVRPSVKLTIGYISFEAYYQHLLKGFLGTDYTIESYEFGLILKINNDVH